jgi:AraC-like DNA-binding protein
MKWCFFLPLIAIVFATFGQAELPADTKATPRDTAEVHKLIRLGKQYEWKDSYRALEYADQALKLARKVDYQHGIALSNNLKGFCFWSFGDNDLAIEVALEALAIGHAENDEVIQAESYYILARGYMDMRELAKANESIAKAESFARHGNNWEQLCSIYNLVGVIKFIDDQEDSALYFYNKAFDVGKSHAVPPINFPRIISNIGECYSEQNPALALTYFREALALAKETQNQIAEASITGIIGHAYLKRNDLKIAEDQLQSALQLARKLGLRRVIRHVYAGLVDIKLKQGKGDEAVVYLRRYHAVNDSLMSTSKIREIVELESRHALQLQEQRLQLVENERQIQTIWKNLLIVLIVLLILISVAIYLQQRYRYRKNREMLNLKIDYLTQQHKETVDKYKAALATETAETLESYDQKLLKKAINLVENHINDPQFGVEKMAEEMGMSRTNLHRKIKTITGFPPSELIRSIRLRKAAKLIVNKVDTVTQVAQLVGFDDYSHFSKAFKKHFGVSPSSYEEHAKTQHQLEEKLASL